MSGQIDVVCIKTNPYGFIVGKKYKAYEIKSAIKDANKLISVIDEFGEEYAYPAELFKLIQK